MSNKCKKCGVHFYGSICPNCGNVNKLKILSYLFMFVLISSVSFAYPQIDYRSVSKEDQLIYNQIEKSIDEKYFVGVNKIIVYGKEMWTKADGMYFAGNGIILIDKSGVYSFEYTLKHEAVHNYCWKKDRDMGHESQCFKNGMQ